jgi:hypothetical protein
MWTKDAILSKLESDNMMVERSLLVMYQRQTADEQQTQGTSHENGVGFNGTDAPFLSKMAEWVKGGAKRNIPEGKRLSEKQRVIVRKKLKKYSRQLIEAANAGVKAY